MIFVPLTFVEGRLHLGKTQKIFDLFGFSLGLHYLCKVSDYQPLLWIVKNEKGINTSVIDN